MIGRRLVRSRFGVLIVGAALLALGSVAAPPAVAAADDEPSIAPPGLGQDDESKILLTIAGDDGSATTIIPQIAENYLRFRGASAIRQSKADPPWTTEVSGTMLNGQRVSVLIRASSSTDGLSLLAAGMADIGLSMREAAPTELPGFMTLQPAELARAARAIALNGNVIIVNKSLGIANLTFDAVRDIYSGKIKDWSEVGARPGLIHYYARAIDYRSSNLIGAAVRAEAGGPSPRIVSSYAAMHDTVAKDEQAIGYVPVSFIYVEHINWKTEKIVPIRFRLGDRLTAMPNEYGLATEDYPLVVRELLYRIPDRDNPEVDSFFERADSVSTRVINMFAGLTVVTPRLLVPIFDQPLPPDYGDMVRNALRVSTTVRFEPGSATVKSRTKQSLDELAAFLRRLDVSADRLRHIAFSEDTGNPERNREIAERLGALFQRELRARNVRTGEVVALGAALPLASDASPLGQWLNRRIETWITP